MKSPREALQPESVPPPPVLVRRRRVSLVSIISGLFSFVIVATIVAAIGWSFASRRVTASGPLTADKTVNIPKGDDVAETLEEQGVIDNAQLMKATLLVEGNKANVKAGEYLFKQNATLQDVIDTLVLGKQVLHSITIPEGLTSLQAVDRLRDNDILVGDIKNLPTEGSLMPDTYKFSRGTTRDQLIKNMQQESRKVVADVWAHRETDTPIRSPSEMVTLASIVEKETGKADERPRVAGVFVNRLVKNIPLQSDPTIVYGLVGGKGTLGRGILKTEVEQKTPYNTYAIVGLPPGPIANPGKAALEAVANPSKTKELYFVADGTGGHVFAETRDQHKANVVRWRQIEKDAKDKLTPDADKASQPITAPPSTKPNQRGDAGRDSSIFGAVQLFGGESGDGGAASASAKFPMALPPDATAQAFATAPATPSGPAFAEVNLDLAGEGTDEVAPGGTEDSGNSGGSMATFPVAPARQADMKARAAAFGLPSDAEHPLPEQAVPAPAEPPLPGGRVRIYDASEGTSLDPLRDKTYDLNSAKSVPVLKPLPPLTAFSAQ